MVGWCIGAWGAGALVYGCMGVWVHVFVCSVEGKARWIDYGENGDRQNISASEVVGCTGRAS